VRFLSPIWRKSSFYPPWAGRLPTPGLPAALSAKRLEHTGFRARECEGSGRNPNSSPAPRSPRASTRCTLSRTLAPRCASAYGRTQLTPRVRAASGRYIDASTTRTRERNRHRNRSLLAPASAQGQTPPGRATADALYYAGKSSWTEARWLRVAGSSRRASGSRLAAGRSRSRRVPRKGGKLASAGRVHRGPRDREKGRTEGSTAARERALDVLTKKVPKVVIRVSQALPGSR